MVVWVALSLPWPESHESQLPCKYVGQSGSDERKGRFSCNQKFAIKCSTVPWDARTTKLSAKADLMIKN